MIQYAAAHRPNGDTVVLAIPKFSSIVSMTGSYYTASIAESENPEFDRDMTFLVGKSSAFDKAIACGLTNVIYYPAYVGETWRFDDGKYITITSTEVSPGRTDYTFTLYNSIGTSIFYISVNSAQSDDYAYSLTSSSVIGTVYPHCGIYFNTALTFQFLNGKCPVNTSTVTVDYWAGLLYADPMTPGGVSGPGGGQGDFSGSGDQIDIPALPTVGAVSTGFITLYNPTLAELNSLASFMWSSSLFDLNTWQKLFADPMDAILGLAIVPVAIPNGGSASVKVGNISTTVTMTKAAGQYVEVDCGTLNVKEYWGAYLDYDPYTKAELYLPYIGTHSIAVDDIMNKSVHVVYHVDILSGACCAYVSCGGTVLYSFAGQCSSSIPVTGGDFTNMISGVLSIGAAVGSMVATGGMSAPLAVPQLANTALNGGMKPSIEKSGAMSGTAGMMGVQTPYLILTRPRQALPKDQNVFIGYPSFVNELLNDVSGYTEIESIHIEGVPATDSELTEIEAILKGGAIF